MEEPLETVATFSFAHEMGLVRSKLESEGIECFVQDELTAQTYIYNAVGGMKLQVRPEDAERAREIIREMGVFDAPRQSGSKMNTFDRITRRMPMLGNLNVIIRFFAFLVLFAVILSIVYMLLVL
ncbi:MAG: DUF2007 domain-containing protein [Marinilabilia sp.]